MSDKMVDKVTSLMKNKEQIRNIAICAHIDHGKCINGNTKLILSDGSFLNAKELYDKIAKDGSLIRKNKTETVYKPKRPYTIFSLDKEAGIIEHKSISHAWKLKGGNLLKIKIRSGMEISTTPEHRYIVLEDMEFVEKEARDIKIGDRVVCARKLVVDRIPKFKERFLKLLEKSNFYVNVKEAYAENVKKRILLEGISNVKTDIKGKSFYHGLWQNRYKLSDISRVFTSWGKSLEELYDSVDKIYFMEKGGVGKASMKINLPKNMLDFYFLAGLMFGDGTGNKFIVGKKELGKEFVRICRDLGFEPVRRNYNGKTPELCSNIVVEQMLRCLFDYPKRKKSHNIQVSQFLAQSPKAYIAQFIRGYFDTDGCVEKSRSAISITSVSSQMLDDLQLLLLQFGIVCIKQGDTMYISGKSAQTFEKEIGFFLEFKKRRLESLVKKTQGSTVLDSIPVSSEKFTSMRKVPMASIDSHYYAFEKKMYTPRIDRCINMIKKFESAHKDQKLIQLEQLKKLVKGEVAFIEVISIEADFAEDVYDFSVPDNKNFIAEGMVIHNTTFSDNLLSGCGMMSKEDAGKALKLDFHDDEQERGITIDTAAVSMVHILEDKEYLINLLDTPGHVDFGGDVTRAMRAVDGAIVLVDAVEGVMPQTETVLRQALREKVRPVLFINKVDRLLKELQLTPEAMQERFVKIITHVNQLIREIATEDMKEKWQVDVQDGSVSFGSAFQNWALSADFMVAKKIGFKDVIDTFKSEDEAKIKELRDKAPLHEVVLNMVIKHLPNPADAQVYRIPNIWKGEIESEEGKALVSCDPNGPLFFVITKIVVDPQAGEIPAGRLFSGTMAKGTEVYQNLAKSKGRVQNVYIYNGAKKEIVDGVPSGNIIGISGVNTQVGETLTLNQTEPFEQISHIFDPVVTKAIEAKKPADLPKLIEVLRIVGKEDPTVKIEIDEETGENLLHGMGELHLEVIENRIRTEKGVEISTSPPIVVYRETVTKTGQEIMGKSPNKHNHIFFTVEPLPESISQAIKDSKIPSGRIKKKDPTIRDAFVEAGMDSKEAVKVKNVFNGNVFVDNTRGQVHIGEVIEMILDMFEDIMKAGPLCKEPSINCKVVLQDMKLHEDAIHRGPAQMYPAVREGIRGTMMTAGPVLFEPLQTLRIEAPKDYMGEISKLVQNKRGQLLEMNEEGSLVIAIAKMPVGEMFGWSSDLRSATGGRGNSSLVDQTFDKLPNEHQEKIIKQIKERKGLTDAMVGA